MPNTAIDHAALGNITAADVTALVAFAGAQAEPYEVRLAYEPDLRGVVAFLHRRDDYRLSWVFLIVRDRPDHFALITDCCAPSTSKCGAACPDNLGSVLADMREYLADAYTPPTPGQMKRNCLSYKMVTAKMVEEAADILFGPHTLVAEDAELTF